MMLILALQDHLDSQKRLLLLTCNVLLASGECIEEHLGTDKCGADGFHPHFPVGTLTDRIVDTADNLLDIEDLFSDLACHNISVVAIGNGDEGVGCLNTGATQRLFVNAIALDLLSSEIGCK